MGQALRKTPTRRSRKLVDRMFPHEVLFIFFGGLCSIGGILLSPLEEAFKGSLNSHGYGTPPHCEAFGDC